MVGIGITVSLNHLQGINPVQERVFYRREFISLGHKNWMSGLRVLSYLETDFHCLARLVVA